MAAPTIVQSAASTAGTSAAARSVTLSGVTSGNLLVVCVFKYAGSELAAGDVSDTLSNTYTSIASSSDRNNKGRLWATKSSSGGEVTITVSNASSGNPYWIVVYELSGTPTEYVDQYAVWAGVGTNPTIDLPNTSYAEDILLGFCISVWAATFTSISSPWELDKTETSISGFYIHTVKATTSSTGNYDLTVTGTASEDWTTLLVAIKGSVAAVTALPRRAIDGPIYGSLRGSVR